MSPYYYVCECNIKGCSRSNAYLAERLCLKITKQLICVFPTAVYSTLMFITALRIYMPSLCSGIHSRNIMSIIVLLLTLISRDRNSHTSAQLGSVLTWCILFCKIICKFVQHPLSFYLFVCTHNCATCEHNLHQFKYFCSNIVNLCHFLH